MNKRFSEDSSAARLYRSPLRSSLAMALIYLVPCATYVALSDHWVRSTADISAEAARLQLIKGILFVGFSAAIIFALSLILLRRIAKTQASLRAERQALVEAERRATAGLLASSVAHDMNNVLTVGLANVEMLRARGTLETTSAEMLRDIERSFDRLHSMSRRLASAHRLDATDPPKQVDLPLLLRDEIKFIRNHTAAADCRIAYHGPDHLVCVLHETAVHELFGNLLINAAESTNGRGEIEVRLETSGKSATIEVHDNGPGIPETQFNMVFEPLFTTKPDGLGLGLPSVKAAAKMHGGWSEVVKSPRGGACFRVTLPVILNPEKM